MLRKRILFLGVILFVLLLLSIIIKKILQLEFTTDKNQQTYESILFLGIPISLLLIELTKNGQDTFGRLFSAVFIIVVSIFVFFMYAISFNLCSWSDERVLFVNKNNSSKKIILRSFGCGAVDSGSPNYDVVKKHSFTSFIARYSKIDTTEIDKSVRVRVKDENK